MTKKAKSQEQYEYSWHPGKGRGVDPQVVGETIVGIQKGQGGACPPGALVDVARPEESPLHSLFEWDDFEAAEKYRQDQARDIIRHIWIKRSVDPEPRPAFVSVKRVSAGHKEPGETGGYVEASVVEANEEQRCQKLHDVLLQLQGIRSRYWWLHEYKEVWNAIDALE